VAIASVQYKHMGQIEMATKLTDMDWVQVRIERETRGTSFPALAKQWGISHQRIQSKAREQGWSDGTDGNNKANILARERAAGIAAASDPAREATISKAADDKVAILVNHRKDWAQHREIYDLGEMAAGLIPGEEDVDIDDPDKLDLSDNVSLQRLNLGMSMLKLKCAKVAADVLKLRQDGERRAYNISDEDFNKNNAPKSLADFYGE
jgi:hypothetical protein